MEKNSVDDTLIMIKLAYIRVSWSFVYRSHIVAEALDGINIWLKPRNEW